MKKLFSLFFLVTGLLLNAQIRGKITDNAGKDIPFVSVSVENTYNNTTANEAGEYEIVVKNPGSYTLIFQSIGYKTQKVGVKAQSLPHIQNVVLADDNYELKEVVVNSGENPANAIIRQAQENKKQNSEKLGRFEADFYSKGMFKVGNLPDKILGQKLEAPKGVLDSSRSGILYLSETVSHITFEQPDKLKERVIASKVSGSDNGFSFNTAMGTFYNFYDDYVDFEIPMVSPISKAAFGYYKYKFEGSTFDDQGHEINKIKVTPKRDKEPVFEGYIYIVSGSWAIYAVDFTIKGYRVQIPMLKDLQLQQNFSYNSNNGLWAKNSQTFDFTAGMFGINFNGKFTHIYSNYIFHDSFDKKTFSREVVAFEKNSNKKDSTYWNTVRPIPLTGEETRDYVKKDSLRQVWDSPKYQDSILKKRNKFHLTDIITGYTYHAKTDTLTKKVRRFSYDGFDIPMFNTVQGWHTENGFSYTRYNKEHKGFYAGVKFNYGLAEDRLRVRGVFSPYLGKKAGSLVLGGGNEIVQFNPSNPISEYVNTAASLLFKDNYMKLYDKTFAEINYTKAPVEWLSLTAGVEYSRRKALFNNTDYVLIKNTDNYWSNDPLQPGNDFSRPFDTHYVTTASLTGRIICPYDYITYPDGTKVSVGGKNYPSVAFKYEKAVAANKDQYKYDYVGIYTKYRESFSNKGDFGIAVNAGKFFGADGISFADYKHFNSNAVHVSQQDPNLTHFNLLPYYTESTNKSFLEIHAEHNFKGYIMNKIPVLNWLQWNLIVGYHSLLKPESKPYNEFTAGFNNIGIGSVRIFRVDYVRSFAGSTGTNGVMFGISL